MNPKRPLIYGTATARLPFNSGDKMVDLTNNKIRPFFHIKNFKDGVADAVLGRTMTKAGRSSEYEEGYEFGLTLIKTDDLGDLAYDDEEEE
jgi:hypothetical protein